MNFELVEFQRGVGWENSDMFSTWYLRGTRGGLNSDCPQWSSLINSLFIDSSPVPVWEPRTLSGMTSTTWESESMRQMDRQRPRLRDSILMLWAAWASAHLEVSSIWPWPSHYFIPWVLANFELGFCPLQLKESWWDNVYFLLFAYVFL